MSAVEDKRSKKGKEKRALLRTVKERFVGAAASTRYAKIRDRALLLEKGFIFATDTWQRIFDRGCTRFGLELFFEINKNGKGGRNSHVGSVKKVAQNNGGNG